VISAYAILFGGVLLLGGRLADLLGRRRVLLTGIATIAVASLVGGLAQSAGVLVGARLAQGLGAALTLPTALSILTTTFAEGRDRNAALGAWGGTGGIASAVGVLIGGVLTEGPGWRWVMFVNPIACTLLFVPIVRLIEGERTRRRLVNFDAVGAVLVTGGMLLLVYALVRAPITGWESARTIAELAGAAALLALAIALEPDEEAPAAAAPVSFATVRSIVDERCVTCHSGAAAPAGIRLDDDDVLRARAARVRTVVATGAMPLGNQTGMTDEERRTVVAWADQGAPGSK